MYDAIIIGMGPAGMNAALYAKRSGLNVLLIDEGVPGGLLNKISFIENYLGFKSITGPELAYNMFEHIKSNDIEYKKCSVLSIEDNDEYKKVITNKGDFTSKGVILAIGRKVRKTGIASENKFTGKGISYCALCDGNLYKNKNVCILGGGDSAFQEAVYLSNIAKKVTIFVRNEITAQEKLVNLAKSKNIEIYTHRYAKDFIGEDNISGVVLDNDEIFECDGVFIYYGYQADTDFLSNLKISDKNGYILTDNSMRTSRKFIYACGDIIKKEVYQIITGVGEAAVAATSLKNDIDNQKYL